MQEVFLSVSLNPLLWVPWAEQLSALRAAISAFAAGACGIHSDYPFLLKKFRRHSYPIVAHGKQSLASSLDHICSSFKEIWCPVEPAMLMIS